MKKKFSAVLFIFLAGIILAGSISYSAVREAYRNRKIENDIEQLQQEAKRIQTENNDLSSRIAYYETPEFQEKIAKEKLNLQKNDEKVVVVRPSIGKQEQVAGPSDEIIEVDQEMPNFIKWWNFFFKYK